MVTNGAAAREASRAEVPATSGAQSRPAVMSTCAERPGCSCAITASSARRSCRFAGVAVAKSRLSSSSGTRARTVPDPVGTETTPLAVVGPTGSSPPSTTTRLSPAAAAPARVCWFAEPGTGRARSSRHPRTFASLVADAPRWNGRTSAAASAATSGSNGSSAKTSRPEAPASSVDAQTPAPPTSAAAASTRAGSTTHETSRAAAVASSTRARRPDDGATAALMLAVHASGSVGVAAGPVTGTRMLSRAAWTAPSGNHRRKLRADAIVPVLRSPSSTTIPRGPEASG